jgi:hypothetical protein
MRPLRTVVPLVLAVMLLSCQDGNGPNPERLAPFASPPLADVIRTRFFHDGFFVHTIPEHSVTFTIGLVDPLSDLPECGGSGAEVATDVRATDQIVTTPAGPLKLLDRVTGTFILYDVSLFDLDSFCDLAGHEVGRGKGSFTRTDNSLTGVGPGLNAFGFMANATLDLTAGGKAKFQALIRWLYDGVDVTTAVDKVELTPIGK